MEQTTVDLEVEQIKTLIKKTDRLKDRIIIVLAAWAGLRANEIAKAKVNDIQKCDSSNKLTERDPKEEVEQGEEIQYFLRVAEKRKKQNEDFEDLSKERLAFIPKYFVYDLKMLIEKEKLDKNDPLVPNKFGKHYTADGIRQRIYKVSEKAYESTGNSDFKEVSSYDLRRFFAKHTINELGKNPNVIMTVGGWDSWESIEKYIDEPSKSHIKEELKNLGRDED